MIGRIVTALVSLAISLLAAELLLRVFVPAPSGPPPLSPELAELPTLDHILELAAPNQRGVYRGVLHETNRFGLRGPEVEVDKGEGVFRIVAFGDSVVMGEGVGVDERYTTLVERALNQRRAGRGARASGRVEIINIGLAGLSLAQAITRLEAVGLRFAPDLLLYGFTINDLEVPAYERFVEQSRSARRIDPPHPSRLYDFVRVRWRGLRELLWPPRDSYLGELNYNYFHKPPVWDAFAANLDRLAAIAGERGICLVVLVHTHLFHLNRFHPLRRHYDAVERAASARAMHVVSSLDYFSGRDPRSLWVHDRDSHPNAAGHAILAEALEAGLDALPRECW